MKYTFNPSQLAKAALAMYGLNAVELVTPKNVKEEKERWLLAAKTGNYTNPHFVYDEDYLKAITTYGPILTIAREKIESGMTPEEKVEQILKNILLSRFDDAIATTEIAASILQHDDQTTCTLASRIYGQPTGSQIVKAYNIVDGDSPLKASCSRLTPNERKALKRMQFDAKAIAFWFTEVIERYCFRDWSVEISDQYASIDARDKNPARKPMIGIPTGRKINGLKLLELIGHEIECHVRGSENCKALIRQILEVNNADSPLEFFVPTIAKSDNELFYEGVAKISDVRILGKASMPKPYATIAYYKACKWDSSFSEIAEEIEECRLNMGESEEEALEGAWTTTYRIMRGCTNTAAGGYAFSKDYIYMAGYELANQISPNLHNFSSMTLSELNALQVALLNLYPTYQNLDAVGWIKERLLSGEQAVI